MPIASIFTNLWSNLEQHEEQGLFLVLVGFILSFAFIRMSTRIIRSEKVSWWPGSVESGGGVHVHHLVFGIVAMLVSGAVGFLAFGRSPATEICAFGFGVGAGLTIDEFALWVHLEDVYWAEEGRSSIDAVVIAVAAMGLVLVGVSPFAIETDSFSAIVSTIVGIALTCTVVAISFLKGRILHGTIGFFFSPFAIYGACRLGKPGSGWARRRYGEHNPEKQAASEARFPPDRRTERVKNAFRDIVGGKPSEGLDAVREEALDAAREVTGTRAGSRGE
jgi:hypothetical protein